jgi:hypothetical protein
MALLIVSQFSPSAAQTAAGPDQAGSQATSTDPTKATSSDPTHAPASNGAETALIKGEVLESVLGREVQTAGEENMGRIIDVLADRNCRVEAAVIEFGGFLGIGTRKIAIAWSALSYDDQRKPPTLILNMTRDQLNKLPEYKPHEPAVTRETTGTTLPKPPD